MFQFRLLRVSFARIHAQQQCLLYLTILFSLSLSRYLVLQVQIRSQCRCLFCLLSRFSPTKKLFLLCFPFVFMCHGENSRHFQLIKCEHKYFINVNGIFHMRLRLVLFMFLILFYMLQKHTCTVHTVVERVYVELFNSSAPAAPTQTE